MSPTGAADFSSGFCENRSDAGPSPSPFTPLVMGVVLGQLSTLLTLAGSKGPIPQVSANYFDREPSPLSHFFLLTSFKLTIGWSDFNVHTEALKEHARSPLDWARDAEQYRPRYPDPA